MPELTIPDWGREFFEKFRYKVAHGGRGSSKSWTFADILLMAALQPTLLFSSAEPYRTLCAREQQNSIKESVHQLLSDTIQRQGYSPYYKVTDSYIQGCNGSEFIFSGIRQNVTKIKSMEGIKVVWVEEAEKVSEKSWRTLIPTIRAPESQIWATFNPDQEEDPTSQRFLVNPPPNALVRQVNWRDNPFFPEELRLEMEYDKRVDPDIAYHIWEGGYAQVSDAQVFRNKCAVEWFEPVFGKDFDNLNWSGPYWGADWGFSQDPTVLVKVWIWKRCLYIEAESYGVGIENDYIAPKWKREIPSLTANDVIYADCSRPETITHVRKKGHLRVEPAEKWDGSVEDGIAFIRSFEKVVINTSCKHAEFEARHYKYKVDKLTGKPTRDLEDKHNHIWDAVRYALWRIIKKKRSIYDAL